MDSFKPIWNQWINYFKRKEAQGKTYGVIINLIKNKMINRAFAVIERQTPYVKRMTYV